MRRRRARFLVVLDADSTLFEDEVIELIAEAAGAREEVAAVTERAMRGELDFAASLRARVARLEGLECAALDAVRARVRVTAGARELVEGVRAAGGEAAVVSGGFHEVLDPLADELGIARRRANRLATRAGRLLGEVEGPVIGREAKREALLEWACELGVPRERTLAIGDGANDLDMMAAAGCSIAFDAKPVVRERASLAMPRRDLGQALAVLGLAASRARTQAA